MKRWKSAKDYLKETYDVVVHFAAPPYEGMYSGAYRYATKRDTLAFLGNCLKMHPDLCMIGKNVVAAAANMAYRVKRAGKRRQMIEVPPSINVSQRGMLRLSS